MSDEAGQVYANGLRFDDFRARLRVHFRAFNDHYERLAFVREEEAGGTALGTSRMLVLTEEYCIDSVLAVPLIARLVEASSGAELRIVRRDAHPALAERFPGRGGTSRLPTVIFLGRSNQALGYWSERSRRDHEWMASFLASDPMPELILDAGRPTPTVAEWMARRLAAQLPFFETQSWRDARDELRAIAAAHGDAVRP